MSSSIQRLLASSASDSASGTGGDVSIISLLVITLALILLFEVIRRQVGLFASSFCLHFCHLSYITYVMFQLNTTLYLHSTWKLDAAVSGHHFFQAVVDLIYREITTLGLVEFCLYLVHKYVDSINYEVEGDYSLFWRGNFSSSSLKLSLGLTQLFPPPPAFFQPYSWMYISCYSIPLYSMPSKVAWFDS